MSFLSDLRIALRALSRRPGFAAAAIATLALGIGANTAVFSVVDGVLWRPLDYDEPDRLVALWPDRSMSTRDVVFFRERGEETFEAVSFVAGWTMALSGREDPTQVYGARTSADLFLTLGTLPLLGRVFVPRDGVAGAEPVVLLSHQLWTNRYGADSSIVGESVFIDGSRHEVVGVMPRDFEIFNPTMQLWVPLPFVETHWTYTANISRVIARLHSTVSIEQAGLALTTLMTGLRDRYGLPDNFGRTATVESLKDHLVGGYRLVLWILLGSVGFILLIAGSNLSNLILVKAESLRPEMALRTALGAPRRRLIQLFMAEALVLSFVGGVLGLGLAFGGVELLQTLVPADTPRVGNVVVDGRVLAVCCAVSLGTGVVFSLLPALVTSRTQLHQHAVQGRVIGKRSSGGAGLKNGWVTTQIALAVILVVGASLMIQTMRGLLAVDPGFEDESVLTLRLQPTGAAYDTPAEYRGFYEDLQRRLRSLPAAFEVGGIQHLPMSGWEWGMPFELAEAPVPEGQSKPVAGNRIVTGDYFQTMRIPLLEGRRFVAGDRAEAEPVAMVNRAFIERFWVGENPLGRQLRLGTEGENLVTVVGVVGDVHHVALDRDPIPEIYRPLSQSTMSAMMLAVRTDGPPKGIARSVQETVWAVDRGVPVSHVMPMRDLVRASLGQSRLVMTLLTVFALVALGLGAVGVYGVTAFAVSRKSREIGIRKALGASDARVRRQVLQQGLASAVVGTLLGLAGAALLGRFLTQLVFEIRPTDPLTFVLVSGLMLTVALVACLVPAWRATRIDPANTLRNV